MVLTVAVSLAIVCAPDPVGVTLALTVPLLVNKLITELIFELMVVDAVRADTTVVALIIRNAGIDTATANLNCFKRSLRFLYEMRC